MRIWFLLFLISLPAIADPLLTSWHIEGSRKYARIYGYQSDIDAQQPMTTWEHPNGATDQLEPTYASVHEVSYDDDFVYVRSTGLGAHVMGPWWQNNLTKTHLFVNWPGAYAFVMKLPRLADISDPEEPSFRTETSTGAVGMGVDGVAIFDSRDALSWDPETLQDEDLGDTTIVGNDYWERDAYVNEGQTFDAAFAHQAGETYHYHASPIGLRYELGDSVSYDAENNVYTESPNGRHSLIIGWMRDGLPLYGPYGYSDPLDANSTVTRMRTGYRARTDLESDGDSRDSYPAWAVRVKGAFPIDGSENGPVVSAEYPRGHYLQDYEYLGDVGETLGVDFDLDEWNTRYCVTPEYPNGVRAYFVSIEEDGTPKFPYNIGRVYYAEPTGVAYNNSDERNGNDFTLPNGVQVYVKGGPEIGVKDLQLDTDSSSSDVVLTWTGVEGGRYVVESSDDLDQFHEIQVVSNEAPAGNEANTVASDYSARENAGARFYKVTRESVDPFDETGFTLESITETEPLAEVTINLSVSGPSDLSIVPNVIQLNGAAVEFVARPSRDQITFRYNELDLSEGDELSLVFADGSTSFGVYSQPISSEATNVLFILIDDWGVDNSPIDNIAGAYNGLAGEGGTDLPDMPYLVDLANESIRFEHAYVQPTCAPTRMSIMTGRSSYSTGVGTPGQAVTNRDSEAIMTIAEAINAAKPEYTSGLIGKWHLGTGTEPGEFGPKAEGWEHFYGAPQGNIENYFNWVRTDIDEIPINQAGVSVNANGESVAADGLTVLDVTGEAARETNYATTVNTDDAISFIQAEEAAGNPWLCWVAYNAPHSQTDDPLFPSPPTNNAGNAEMNGEEYIANLNTNHSRYKAALWALDSELNRLLSNVDLTKTTVILLGDNGSPGSRVQNTNLFDMTHAKETVYDGGVHVPMIIRPAGGLTAQRLISEPVQGTDLFPTMCELMGIDTESLGQTLDGESLIGLMNGISNPNKIVLAETFEDGAGARALRLGNYKLIITDDPYDNSNTPVLEFFDLSVSLRETADENLLREGVVMNAEEQAAYDVLLLENERLNTFEINFMTSEPLVSELVSTSVDLTGVSGVLNDGTVLSQVPSSNAPLQDVRVGNETDGYVSAINLTRTSDGTTTDRFWVSFDFDVGISGMEPGVYDIIVQYGGAGGTKFYTLPDAYTHP